MKKLRQLTPLVYGIRQDEFSSLESRLRASFDPVTPNPEFVHKLREQLINQWGALSHLPNTNTPAGIILVIAGIISGFLFIVVVIRALIILLGLISVYREFQRKTNGGNQTPANLNA